MAKNYHSTTGVEEFYYGVLSEEDETKIVKAQPELIDYLQEITVTREQTLERAYGSNKVAEIAISNGPVEVSSTFHKLPKEDLITLLGLSEVGSLYGLSNQDNPPYVAVVFAKTREDGSKEWVGLPKGKFTTPEQSATTKTDSVEFGSDEIAAEFMDRRVNVFDKDMSVVFAETKSNDDEAVEEFFQAVFGTSYPKNSKEEPIEEPIEEI